MPFEEEVQNIPRNDDGAPEPKKRKLGPDSWVSDLIDERGEPIMEDESAPLPSVSSEVAAVLAKHLLS